MTSNNLIHFLARKDKFTSTVGATDDFCNLPKIPQESASKYHKLSKIRQGKTEKIKFVSKFISLEIFKWYFPQEIGWMRNNFLLVWNNWLTNKLRKWILNFKSYPIFGKLLNFKDFPCRIFGNLRKLLVARAVKLICTKNCVLSYF